MSKRIIQVFLFAALLSSVDQLSACSYQNGACKTTSDCCPGCWGRDQRLSCYQGICQLMSTNYKCK